MAQQPTIYAGTIGQSVWRSKDGGDSWHRASAGIFLESEVRALVVHPANSSILFAGTDAGVFRTESGGDKWERLDSPMNEMSIWSIAISPKNPNTIYAGTCPSSLFKSVDGGETWKRLNVELAEECAGGLIIPRVTSLVIDPEEEGVIYAGIEIDGMRISTDGGETWVTRNDGLSSLDIHGLTVAPGEVKTLVAATNNDVCLTTDMTHWTPLNVKNHFPWSYCRAAMYLPGDSGRVFIGAGNGPPGDEGGIFHTRDLGQSWTRIDLRTTANSTIWCFAHHPAVSNWMVACSVSGQLFRSVDGGNSWTKLKREFGEVRALAVTPPNA